MQHIAGRDARTQHPKIGKATCLARVPVDESNAAAMLQGCAVVTANGESIGRVRQLVIDVRTQQLRYVIVSGRRHRSAEIAIPWKTLYFDSAMSRLVFYTWP